MPDFLKKLQNAKTRNVVILLVVISVTVILFGIYRATREAPGETGNVKLQQIPSEVGLQPGAKNLSKEYLKTLLEANQVQTKKALQTGKSSIPVLVDTGVNAGPSSENLGEGQNSCFQQCVSCCQGQSQSATSLMNEWVKEGKMSPETAAILSRMQDKHLSVSDYAAQLDQLVREGKLTPEQAQKLLEAYKKEYQKGEPTPAQAPVSNAPSGGTTGVGGGVSGAVAQATADLKKSNALSPDVADQLQDLKNSGANAADYATKLSQLVKDEKLSPEPAQKLLSAYRREFGDVKITAPQPQLAQLERAQQKETIQQQQAAIERIAAERAQRAQEQLEQRQQAAAIAAQQRQQNVQASLGKQMQALITAWTPNVQVSVGGGSAGKAASGGGGSGSSGGEAEAGQGGSSHKSVPLVKAGTIMFAVLDTSINTDQPGPVMATMVSGLFKGGKLMGTITQTPDQQRVMLKFTMLSMPDRPDTIPINAVALNPDTAKTAIASQVDNHYLQRYGALFAANFMSGYANALKTGGTTTTTSSGSVVQTGPDLSSKQKTLYALGEVGQKLSQQWTPLFNRPATVTVEAGVGLGVLFVENVANFKQQ